MDIAGALHLESVGAVVPPGVGIEELVEIGHELEEIHKGMVTHCGVTLVKPMRNASTLCLLGLLSIAAVSCGKVEPPKEEAFRVRLLTAVDLSGRWEREAERGLGLIAAELDAHVARSRASGTADQRTRLRTLARDGIDLVFCVGPEVEALVYTEAVAFPDTVFVLLPGEIQGANIGSIAFMPEEAGYLAGAVAGGVTDTEVVGLLRGAGRPWLERLETGFAAGFRSTHPDAEIATARGLEGPWQLASAGAEVALYSTDRIEPEVMAAAHDAGLYLVGTDPALMEAEPDFVIAAIEVDVAEAMLRVAREVHDHTFTGRLYAFDLGSGVLDLELNSSLAPPDREIDLRDALERARSEITAGWVEIEELGIGR